MTYPAITAKGENYDPLNIKQKYRLNNNGRLGIIHQPHPPTGIRGRPTDSPHAARQDATDHTAGHKKKVGMP